MSPDIINPHFEKVCHFRAPKFTDAIGACFPLSFDEYFPTLAWPYLSELFWKRPCFVKGRVCRRLVLGWRGGTGSCDGMDSDVGQWDKGCEVMDSDAGDSVTG